MTRKPRTAREATPEVIDLSEIDAPKARAPRRKKLVDPIVTEMEALGSAGSNTPNEHADETDAE